MWDPKNRPTTKQAMEHEFFSDAVDPLRPKSSSRLLGRKHSDLSFRSKDTAETPTITSKPSWFRRSLIARDSAPAVPQHNPDAKVVQTESDSLVSKLRPQPNKRATWANGTNASGGAPMPILPSIRPISPLPNAVTAQASSAFTAQPESASKTNEEKSKKIGRQLSINSHGNHYADLHRQEAERALNANSGLASPPSGHKESFFSHLRKRARRFSGRHGLASPNGDDVEANAANVPWSNRSSLMVDSIIPETTNTDFSDLDKILQNVRYSLDRNETEPGQRRSPTELPYNQGSLKRTHSVPRSQGSRSSENPNQAPAPAPTAMRSRRPLQINQYETPEEADELLDEALRSASRVAKRLDQSKEQPHRTALAHKDYNRQSLPHIASASILQDPYLTPSPSAKRNGVQFNPSNGHQTQPLNITKQRPEHEHVPPHWPTPPYEENEWAAAAASSIFAAGSSIYR